MSLFYGYGTNDDEMTGNSLSLAGGTMSSGIDMEDNDLCRVQAEPASSSLTTSKRTPWGLKHYDL